MAMIRCPECGRMISDESEMCLGCGISQEKIQKKLKERQDPKPITRKSRKMLTCVACHAENEEGISPVCKSCGYPLLSLSSNKKQVKKAVEAYKRRETEKEPEKPVQTTDTPEKPEQEPVKPTPAEPKPQEPKPPTPPIPPTPPMPTPVEKSGKIKAIALAVVGVACACFVLYPKTKPDPQPEASTERTVSSTSDNVEAVSEFETAGTATSSGNYNIGDTLTFGSYEQDNNPNNGTEEIEWLLLDQDEEGYLLVSKYGLDAKPYNEDLVDITWETCTLRSWLNEEFYMNAFGSEEREQIRTTHVIAEKNPSFDTNPGNNTDDSVFLLSIQEAEKYFASDEERKAYPTEYAKANGAHEDSSTKCCWWWLRSPGYDGDLAARVLDVGGVGHFGFSVDIDFFCVRPALWVNL